MQPSNTNAAKLAALTADIATAYLSRNHLQTGEVPRLIAEIHGALRVASHGTPVQEGPPKPTASEIRRSVTPEALISFEDGKPYKTLRRHLTRLGLTPETYRQKWGLPPDYPMTSAEYSKRRSELARALTLGLPIAKPERAGAAKTAEGALP
ncbi:transcriptional regulator, MucR family [Methylobacterium sp. 4-46]|uniref:MucR family transcriptional regulator n=1 Tax=unclassified Methylobacterium TaxID=2615210 RepID=UPI000152D4FF|nr:MULTISPECIES: MucR family transcriptional regulator [Methylobacterium]ACA14847.1 transcriptional regulator, MucR family [Methylobacterium sp. 4-46]WFT80590.1 MucR family transcriptional regulator [Methylobacterium nodulans]